MALADLGVVFVLARLLRRRERTLGPAWLYALHPLGAVEAAGSGHMEAWACCVCWQRLIRGTNGVGGCLGRPWDVGEVAACGDDPRLWQGRPWLLLPWLWDSLHCGLLWKRGPRPCGMACRSTCSTGHSMADCSRCLRLYLVITPDLWPLLWVLCLSCVPFGFTRNPSALLCGRGVLLCCCRPQFTPGTCCGPGCRHFFVGCALGPCSLPLYRCHMRPYPATIQRPVHGRSLGGHLYFRRFRF